MPGCSALVSFSNCALVTSLMQSLAGGTSPIGPHPPFRVITGWSIPTASGLPPPEPAFPIAAARAACLSGPRRGGAGGAPEPDVWPTAETVRTHEIERMAIDLHCMKGNPPGL